MQPTVPLIRLVGCVLVLAASLARVAVGRDVAGQWQGVLPVQGGLRMVIKVTQAESGQLSATLTNVDRSPEEHALKDVTLQGSAFHFGFELAADHYEGTLSEDGTTISGQWFGSVHPGTPYPFDLHRATDTTRWTTDAPPFTTQFVTVEEGVKLEVLDWGGTGRPLVFLAGLGNDAHIFGKFAPKFTATCHVYGITRRGFGASSDPEPTADHYAADRLGDDVLAVIDALKLDRPVLAGHSIAGEELSSVGSRYPERIAGLIYLDAAYGYAFYDRDHGDIDLDGNATLRKLARLLRADSPTQEGRRLTQELLQTDLPQLTKSLEQLQQQLEATPDTDAPASSDSRKAQIARAILAGGRPYTEIHCPILAIYALAPDSASKLDEVQRSQQAAQAKAFQAGVPSAKVVLLPNANHYVFSSNEAEVLKLMQDFLAKLPPDAQ